MTALHARPLHIALLAVLCLSAVGCTVVPKAAPPPIVFFRGGDDGLTISLFDAVTGGEANWRDCSIDCFPVTLDQLSPTGDGAFSYKVDIGPKGGGPDAPGIRTVSGRCREAELETCAAGVRRRIGSAVAAMTR